MEIFIDGYDFWNMEAEKYWAPTKGTNLKDLVNKAINSGDYLASEKVDGDWRMLIKDMEGNFFLRGRSESVNGGYANKIDWVPHIAEELKGIPNGTVLLGEMYLDSKRGSRNVTTIMGCLSDKAVARQAKGEKLSYYIFDCLAYSGESLINEPLIERLASVNDVKEITKGARNIVISKYYKHSNQIEALIGEVLASGREGVVLKRTDGIYEPGKRPVRKSIKVKKEIEEVIDCFLTGNYKDATWDYSGKEIDSWEYWYNIRTEEKFKGKYYTNFLNGASLEPITKGAYYGWAGAVEIGVYKNDKIVPIGWISNVTEEVKSGIVNEPEKWKYRVVKVTAMMLEEDTKALRHGKIIEWREDKNYKDCDGHELNM